MYKSILLSIITCIFFLFNGFAYNECIEYYQVKKEPIPHEIEKVLEKNKCLSCHAPYRRLVGPSFLNIGQKKYNAKTIAELMEKPQPSNWPGYPAMAPIKNVTFADVCKITAWINSLEP